MPIYFHYTGAISAGCCAVIKPSEVGPSSSAVIKKYFDLYLDPLCYRFWTGVFIGIFSIVMLFLNSTRIAMIRYAI